MNGRRFTSTYRLQLTPEFDFDAARGIVEYLERLGVGALYLSPIFEARPGSPHGYDVIDPTRVRDELGGESAFVALAEAAHDAGLGLLLDIVPNHMAADSRNRWWWAMLKRGAKAEEAAFFDVTWHSGTGDRRIVLPVLGDELARELRSERLTIDVGSPHDPEECVIRYFDTVFPVDPETFEDDGDVAELLARQHYELAFWRDGLRRINYRRFFDISDLAAVQVEDAHVFEATHVLVRRLVRDGLIDGLRVDHIDGLRDPHEYLQRLRRLVNEEVDGETFPILVEKILGHDETLKTGWPVQGTTGYEWLNAADRLFVQPAGLGKIKAHARQIGACGDDFHETVRRSKRDVIEQLFVAEIDRLVSMGAEAADERNAGTDTLRKGIVDVSIGLDVYRTYVRSGLADDDDRRRIMDALGEVEAGETSVRNLFEQALGCGEGHDETVGRFMDAWQMTTGPVTAKGVEDTALYRHVTLSSLNEVGGEPVLREDATAAFHAVNRTRATRWPGALNASSTHDTKRGEDARMRLHALSEVAGEWIGRVDEWRRRHAPLREKLTGGECPEPHDEMLIYQSVLAIWPVHGEPASIATRVCAYMTKAVREAKLRSCWYEPDLAYERGIERFVRALLVEPDGQSFRVELSRLAERVSMLGTLNSLAELVLKCISPGVPDFYQGSELWNLTLVDPDNRREVDYATRHGMLLEVEKAPWADLLATGQSEAIKLRLMQALMQLRRIQVELFARGDYVPLPGNGQRGEHVVAFARRWEGRWLLAIVPRWCATIVESSAWPLGAAVWGDTRIELPGDSPRVFENPLTGQSITIGPEQAALRVAEVLKDLPVAVLIAG